MKKSHIDAKFPQSSFEPVLISEVTRMSGEMRCVAGLNVASQAMVRPLKSDGSNWRLGDDRSVFKLGHLIDLKPTGRRGAVLPHATEDTPLRDLPVVLERFDEATAHALLVDSAAKSVSFAVGVTLHDAKFVDEGTRCPSLFGVRAPRRKIRFHTGFDEKLKLQVDDADGAHYDLSVTCDRILSLFDGARGRAPLGADEANDWLGKYGLAENVILRVGMARPWDGNRGWEPRRCYLQLNGIVCPKDELSSIR
jgi:hypothetical protein